MSTLLRVLLGQSSSIIHLGSSLVTPNAQNFCPALFMPMQDIMHSNEIFASFLPIKLSAPSALSAARLSRLPVQTLPAHHFSAAGPLPPSRALASHLLTRPTSTA